VVAPERCHNWALPSFALPQLPAAQFADCGCIVARHLVTLEASHACALAQAFALTIWIERGAITRTSGAFASICSVAMRTHVTMNDG
jgi:hypothetical protein